MSTVAQQIDEITADVIRRAFEAGRKEAARESPDQSYITAELESERCKNSQLKNELLAARVVLFVATLIFFALLVWSKQ